MADASPNEVFRQRYVLTSAGDDARRAQDSLLEAVEARQYDPGTCFAIRLALEEALSNAYIHGNGNDPAKALTVEYTADEGVVAIVVEDEGRVFDPDSVPDPTRPENRERSHGRGLFLLRSLADDVRFNEQGNSITLTLRD